MSMSMKMTNKIGISNSPRKTQVGQELAYGFTDYSLADIISFQIDDRVITQF